MKSSLAAAAWARLSCSRTSVTGLPASTAGGKQVLPVFLPLQTAQRGDAGAGWVLGEVTVGLHKGSVLGRRDGELCSSPPSWRVVAVLCRPRRCPSCKGILGQLGTTRHGSCWLLPCTSSASQPLGCVCLAFPACFRVNKGRGSQPQPLVPGSRDQGPAGSTATASLCLQDLLLARERSSGAG